MSKIGKKIITIPEEITVKKTNDILEFSSKDGKKNIKVPILPYVESKIDGNILSFTITNDRIIQAKANWGTMRALSQNAINGIKNDFSEILDMTGIGFRVVIEGKNLVLSIGFSHPVKFAIPEGIIIAIDKNNSMTITGIDKKVVGQTAAKIRSLKKPNPYLGTGIKYREEVIRRKAGKKAAGTTGAAS